MRLRVNAEKRSVHSFGFRTGYWYCIPSVFVQVNVFKWYWSFWVERGDKRWTPAELSADRRAKPEQCCVQGEEPCDECLEKMHRFMSSAWRDATTWEDWDELGSS